MMYCAEESVNAGEMSSRRFRAVVGLMKVPERELMGDVLLRDSAEPSLPVHVNIAKFVRLDEGQYIDTEDRDKAVKRRQLANAKERLRVSVWVCVCAQASFVPHTRGGARGWHGVAVATTDLSLATTLKTAVFVPFFLDKKYIY